MGEINYTSQNIKIIVNGKLTKSYKIWRGTRMGLVTIAVCFSFGSIEKRYKMRWESWSDNQKRNIKTFKIC